MKSYWVEPPGRPFSRLGSQPSGLSSAGAQHRLRQQGPNCSLSHRGLSRLRVLWSQLRSPLLLLLLFATAVSAFTGEWTDAGMVLAIVAATVGSGMPREIQRPNRGGSAGGAPEDPLHRLARWHNDSGAD